MALKPPTIVCLIRLTSGQRKANGFNASFIELCTLKRTLMIFDLHFVDWIRAYSIWECLRTRNQSYFVWMASPIMSQLLNFGHGWQTCSTRDWLRKSGKRYMFWSQLCRLVTTRMAWKLRWSISKAASQIFYCIWKTIRSTIGRMNSMVKTLILIDTFSGSLNCIRPSATRKSRQSKPAFQWTSMWSQLINPSVIAISGLDGHAYGSWQAKGNLTRMWLCDFFRRDFPRCRTMIYGYNSKLSSRGISVMLDYGREFLEQLQKIRYSKKASSPLVLHLKQTCTEGFLFWHFTASRETSDLYCSQFRRTHSCSREFWSKMLLIMTFWHLIRLL